MAATFAQFSFQLNGRGLTDPTLPLSSSNVSYILDSIAVNGVTSPVADIPSGELTALTTAITNAINSLAGLTGGVSPYLGTITYVPTGITGLSSGKGYAVGDTFVAAGSTFTVATLSAGQLVAAVQAPGNEFNIGDNITLPNGVVLKVTTLAGRVTGITPDVAGTGYAVNDTVTLVDGIIGTVATVGSGGAIETVTVTNAGSLSSADIASGAVPSEPITPTATSGAGTGATFYVNWTAGVGSVNVFEPGLVVPLSAGSATAATVVDGSNVAVTNPVAMVAGVNGTNGSNATFNLSFTYGVATATVTSAVAETTIPANPVAQTSTNHNGTGEVFNITWAAEQYVGAATIAAAGTGYAVNDVLTLTGTGGATIKVLTVNSGAVATFEIVNQGSLVPSATSTSPVATTGGTGTGATFNLTLASQA